MHFCTPAGRVFDIPLKAEHVYLGLTISYHQAQSLSVAHRIPRKLRPLLTSASAPLEGSLGLSTIYLTC